ncbi:MAG: NAD(P)/FAD-dependent oxidoreductase [Candidatus Binatales bacterium]
MKNPDVIVIGAGVVGCSLAFHLARDGAKVAVLDKGRICAGMSARSGALVRMHYTFGPEAALAWKSFGYFTHWPEIIGPPGCGFVRTGFAIVVAAENVDRLRSNVAMLQRIGVDTRTIDPKQLREIEPEANVEDVAMAAYEPQSGYADPVATTLSLANAAQRAGVEFILDTPVAAIETRGGRVSGVTDALGRRHEAGAVCVVAGPWTDRLIAPLGGEIGIKAERAQIAFFKRPAAMRHCVYIDTIAGGYFRPQGDDLTLAGLGAWRPESEADPDRFRETNDAGFIEAVRERLAQRLPRMAGAPYERGHAGIYDMSPDGRAVLGAIPGVDGLFVAAGFSGTGFKTAPAVGAAMAELILTGGSKTVDLSPFGFGRFAAGQPIRNANEYSMGADFGHTL